MRGPWGYGTEGFGLKAPRWRRSAGARTLRDAKATAEKIGRS